MNKEWAEKNKRIQTLLTKEESFNDAIRELLELRKELFECISTIIEELPRESLSLTPFINQDGYHSKSIVYSIWHIFRIEDIVAHELIANDEQVLFKNNYLKKINSPIITTGNELSGDEIRLFSESLNIDWLYRYAEEVLVTSNQTLLQLNYKDTKKKFNEEHIKKLINTKCVGESESWLITYWCSKDVMGLIKMPFSRHWIMHIEAMLRIENRLLK